MFSQPNKIKFSKVRKGRLKRLNFKSNSLKFGSTGLKTVESGTISFKQLESARQAISRKIKRKGKLWSRVPISIPITSKPLEVRMGKGTGSISHWAAKVKGGTVLFELCGVNHDLAKSAFKTGAAKLCIGTKFFF